VSTTQAARDLSLTAKKVAVWFDDVVSVSPPAKQRSELKRQEEVASIWGEFSS